MTGSTGLVRDPRVLSRRVADGFLLLGPEDDAPTHIAGAAARVWDILESRRTEAEMVRLAAEESGIGQEQSVALVGESLELLTAFISRPSAPSGQSP